MPTAPALSLVTGDEELLVARAVARIVAAARAADAGVDVSEHDTDSLDPRALLDLATPSLFGEHRVVVLRLAARLDDVVRDAVLEFISLADEGLSVVVVHPGGNTGKRVVDACKTAGATVVPCAKVEKLRERVDFVAAEFASAGAKVTESVARALVEAVGNELRELAAACSQLVSDTGGAVDEAAVQRYFRGRAEATGFAVADRALEGNERAALLELRQALQAGLDPVLVVAALARQLRTVARVASEGSRTPQDAVARKLKMPPWMVDKARRQSRGWHPDTLTSAYDAVAVADAEVKGGGTDPAFAVERAVRLVAACGAAR